MKPRGRNKKPPSEKRMEAWRDASEEWQKMVNGNPLSPVRVHTVLRDAAVDTFRSLSQPFFVLRFPVSPTEWLAYFFKRFRKKLVAGCLHRSDGFPRRYC